MARLNFGGVEETVVTREEFTLDKAREVLKNETIAVIGYGVQGPGQGLNLRDTTSTLSWANVKARHSKKPSTTDGCRARLFSRLKKPANAAQS